MEKGCEIFCGSKFLQVREEFYEGAKVKRGKFNYYDIILGGTDISGLSAKIPER